MLNDNEYIVYIYIQQDAAESPKLEQYKEYIKYELSQDEPARIQCIFERAIKDNCLSSDIWIQYAKYLVSIFFSSTGRDQSSLCDTPLSVCPSICL